MISSWTLCSVSSRVPDTSKVSDQALQLVEQGLEDVLVLPGAFIWAVQHHLHQGEGITPSQPPWQWLYTQFMTLSPRP